MKSKTRAKVGKRNGAAYRTPSHFKNNPAFSGKKKGPVKNHGTKRFRK